MTGLRQRNCFRSIHGGLELNSLRICALFSQSLSSNFTSDILLHISKYLITNESYQPPVTNWPPSPAYPLLPAKGIPVAAWGTSQLHPRHWLRSWDAGPAGRVGPLPSSLSRAQQARLCQQITDPNSRTQLWLPGDSQSMSQMSVPMCLGATETHPPGASSCALQTFSAHLVSAIGGGRRRGEGSYSPESQRPWKHSLEKLHLGYMVLHHQGR